jgi:DNA-binding PadR family transcriptional regulator
MIRMKDVDTTPSQALPDLVFHVLLALGHGPSHGYAIGKDVEEQSGGRLDPTTGALYQVLRRLTDEGLVAPVAGPEDVDPRRKYFALTRAGRRAAALEAERLAALVRAARQRKLYPQRA